MACEQTNAAHAGSWSSDFDVAPHLRVMFHPALATLAQTGKESNYLFMTAFLRLSFIQFVLSLKKIFIYNRRIIVFNFVAVGMRSAVYISIKHQFSDHFRNRRLTEVMAHAFDLAEKVSAFLH